jgi:hypothetical protein
MWEIGGRVVSQERNTRTRQNILSNRRVSFQDSFGPTDGDVSKKKNKEHHVRISLSISVTT